MLTLCTNTAPSPWTKKTNRTDGQTARRMDGRLVDGGWPTNNSRNTKEGITKSANMQYSWAQCHMGWWWRVTVALKTYLHCFNVVVVIVLLLAWLSIWLLLFCCSFVGWRLRRWSHHHCWRMVFGMGVVCCVALEVPPRLTSTGALYPNNLQRPLS